MPLRSPRNKSNLPTPPPHELCIVLAITTDHLLVPSTLALSKTKETFFGGANSRTLCVYEIGVAMFQI
jgi:hypothetical protein